MRGDRKYLAISFLVLTFLSLSFYYLSHQKNEIIIKDMEKKIAENKIEIQSIKKFDNNHKNIDEEIENLSERHFRVSEFLPEKLSEENIIDSIKEHATNNQIDILTINIDGQKDKFNDDTNFYEAKFDIKVRGDYFHIADFMNELYNSDKFFDIRSVNLKNDNGNLTLDLNIICYYLKRNTR